MLYMFIKGDQSGIDEIFRKEGRVLVGFVLLNFLFYEYVL
jgi:hypothetical protein